MKEGSEPFTHHRGSLLDLPDELPGLVLLAWLPGQENCSYLLLCGASVAPTITENGFIDSHFN